MASRVLGSPCVRGAAETAAQPAATNAAADSLLISSEPAHARKLTRTASWYHARLLRAAWPPLLASVLVTVLATLGCVETAPGPLAGASDVFASEPTPAPRVAVPLTVWDGYAGAKRWAPTSAAPFTSQGHLPASPVDVRVNATASASYAALVTDTVFPEGSVLLELSHSLDGHGYAMRKANGAWSYFELDAQGGVLASGALSLCAGCHAQAPADHVFGLPRAP